MIKRELLKKLEISLQSKGIYSIDEIGTNSNKSEIENAINCLNCTDETMNDYLAVIKLKYPNIYNTVTQTNYLTHRYNRLWIYNTARLELA
jgi:4-diphosphocytidyl-2C-methyl-D-erythritol kinase